MPATLFVLTVDTGAAIKRVYVVAEGSSEAEQKLHSAFSEWEYDIELIQSIERIAQEGCYGKPTSLIR